MDWATYIQVRLDLPRLPGEYDRRIKSKGRTQDTITQHLDMAIGYKSQQYTNLLLLLLGT